MKTTQRPLLTSDGGGVHQNHSRMITAVPPVLSELFMEAQVFMEIIWAPKLSLIGFRYR